MVWNDAQESVFLKSCPSASSDEPELLDACVMLYFLWVSVPSSPKSE